MYKKQSAFKGSNRELRAKILRATLAGQSMKNFQLENPKHSADAIKKNIAAMKKEGLLQK
jgi:hypothetical protein